MPSAAASGRLGDFQYWVFYASRGKISDAELVSADGVHTVDPDDANAAGHKLWGHRSAASQEGRSEADKLILEIAFPSDDHVALLALITRIEKAKGSLTPDVAVLGKNLAT